MMVKKTYKCKWRNCKKPFEAREADRNRGWAQFCSKSCKAKEQESRTGQNKKFKKKYSSRARKDSMEYGGIPQYDSRGEYEGFVYRSFGPWDWDDDF